MQTGQKSVVVFGATGELGSRIAAGCVRAGHRVIGVSRGSNQRHRVALDGVEMVHGDKNSEEFIKGLKSRYSFDTVIDTSLRIEGMKLLHKYFHDVENIITCSSVGTYAPLLSIPANESNPWRQDTGINFFWQSERDGWAIDRYHEDNFPITILRPTCINGYGRVPLELWGFRNITFWRILKESRPIGVPEHYRYILLQGACNDDLATAFVNAVGRGKRIHGEIIIISSYKALTLERYLQTAMTFLNSSSPIEPMNKAQLRERYGAEMIREKDFNYLMEHSCFDMRKAERLLNYRPRFSPEEALVRGLQWCLDSHLL